MGEGEKERKRGSFLLLNKQGICWDDISRYMFRKRGFKGEIDRETSRQLLPPQYNRTGRKRRRQWWL